MSPPTPVALTRADNLLDFINAIEYRIARSREELEKAYALVYREYLKRGYVKENPSGMRISIHNAGPQTTTFVAISGSEVVATATIIPDSPLGLPMDAIYHEELNQFRAKKLKLCEVSMLASDTELFQQGVSMMLNSRKLFFVFFLFKLMFDYAKDALKLDLICITINPKHKLTYDFLMFKDLGGLRTYGSVNGAPAIAEYLEIATAEDDCRRSAKPGIAKMFFAAKTDPEKFSGKYALTRADLEYFFQERTNILTTASKDHLDYLKSCY
ncbi:MAG TPA: hypothetical protein VMD52_01390 [Patescibacteria group bacterium]|nr:hypothetical protein [Patescibacteria group bacterium]